MIATESMADSKILVLIENSNPDSLAFWKSEKYPWQTAYADHFNDTRRLMAEVDFDVVIVHQEFGDDVIGTVSRINRSCPQAEIIVILSDRRRIEDLLSPSVPVFDYLVEPTGPSEIRRKIEMALSFHYMKQERQELRARIAMNYSFDSFVGTTADMELARKTIGRIAPTDIPVLIVGDSGTGKSLAAQMIHQYSKRSQFRPVLVDCSLLPGGMIEQLFALGGQNGAGTAATSNPLVHARVSTLILEHVDKLSVAAQDCLSELLRNIAGNEQGDSSWRPGIRLISTSGTGLDDLVAQGLFDRDLAQRLGVISVMLPRLADRKEDIGLLAEHFLRNLSQNREGGCLSISRSAKEALARCDWSHNVRELELALMRAAANCTGNYIDVEHLDIPLLGRQEKQFPSHHVADISNNCLEENERMLIERTLAENNWNFTQTAQELGIGRTTLWRKVKKFNLKRLMVPT